jgi:4-hydroxy-2-oxoheptanedioate aldolase
LENGIVNLKERIAAGQCLIGVCFYSHSPDVVEFTGAEMDWLWWEAQHDPCDWQSIVHGVRAAYAVRMPMLIRTWTHNGDTIERLLDTGAEGIIVPTVDTPEQAREIVARCYYPPVGRRSFGSIRPQCVEPNTDAWNRRVVTIMMVETPESLANAEAIAAVPGVDGLLMGARDLTLRLGRTWDPTIGFAIVAEEMKQMVEACRRAGKAAGNLAMTPEDITARIQEGHRLICAGTDVDHLKLSFRNTRRVFDAAARQLGIPTK